ncbi:MAG: hypothetical protein D4R81_11550 [Nitrospiraceae bacterium]|nr:MAG: hypothetical protein D4R81_11550 [Nitrospiraceae bacterium]
MIFRILWVVAAITFVPLPGATQTGFDPLLLNIRMSPGALHPPADMIKQQWTLDGYRLGRLGPQAPRAAIIEDDARRRLLILSAAADGTVLVYRLEDLPMDVAQQLPRTLTCSRARQCQHNRSDPAGELGCLALCLLEHLRE